MSPPTPERPDARDGVRDPREGPEQQERPRSDETVQAPTGDAIDAAGEGTDTPLERVAETVADTIATAGAAAGRLLASARKLRPKEARLARLRRAARSPLPNLFEEHPEARFAPRRSLGLKTIPVEQVIGTAVEGPAQRVGDFRPLPRLRGDNWNARWQRLRAAQDALAILPPIDVFQAAGGYWVIDGHNRVAAALYAGQDDIDAAVTHIHLPGEQAPEETTGFMSAELMDADVLRAAGEGRLTRGASIPRRARAGKRPDARPEGQTVDAADPDDHAPNGERA